MSVRSERRAMGLMEAGIVIVGATLQAASFSLAQLIAGRIVTGFGNGFVTATASTSSPASKCRLIRVE